MHLFFPKINTYLTQNTTEETMTTAQEYNTERHLQNQFGSIQDLLAYIKTIEQFDRYQTVDNNEEHEKKYPYQIPLETWNSETGWQMTDRFCLDFADGAIFVDRYFDSDYRDYDMPTRYVYLCCFRNSEATKTSPVSLFMSGKYNDKILFDDDIQTIAEYCGQTKGGRDHLIGNGAFVFIKEKGYKFLGKVTSAKLKGKENGINVYTLVIQKETNILKTFRVKNEICNYFGWPQLNSFERTHGIIQHK